VIAGALVLPIECPRACSLHIQSPPALLEGFFLGCGGWQCKPLQTAWSFHPCGHGRGLVMWRLRSVGLSVVLVLLALLPLALPVRAAWADDGAQLFEAHCAGCHVNGGNIIRRGKTLQRSALERQGLDSRDAIAQIAAEGIGQMSGYREQLGDQGIDAVADWVWQQVQLGWPKPA